MNRIKQTMTNRSNLLAIGLPIAVSLSLTHPAAAQTSNYYAGQAVDGRSVNVDLQSISRASARSVNFTYYLGDERVDAQANCDAGTWTTFPERAVHRPQSQATQNMLDRVCSAQVGSTSPSGVAVVFDPPSNVRTAPNGDVLCSVRERTTINLYGSTGDWYYTDVCGRMGVIHSSQLRF
jgi:hypothetical protein